MHDDTKRDYLAWGVVIGALLLVFVGAGALLGGQSSTILSTVGAAVDSNVGTGIDPSSDGSGDTAGNGDATGGPRVADAAGVPTLLIVRTGELELEVTALAPALAGAAGVVTSGGGYISASNETGAGDDAGASVSYRVPAAAWDTTLAGIRDIATAVVRQQVDTEEVSGQVVDLGARTSNLRATEAALQAIMARATEISDVLDVQKQLTTTRGEIERLVADKTQLEGRAAYGSLKVTFHLPAPAAVTTAQKGWDPLADADRATGRLIAIGQWGASVAIFLAIVGLPLLIAGSLLAVAAWRIYRFGRWFLGRRTVESGLPS